MLSIPLNTGAAGASIPQIGLGTWLFTYAEAAGAVVAAAQAGVPPLRDGRPLRERGRRRRGPRRPELAPIAAAHGVTVGQVVLR